MTQIISTHLLCQPALWKSWQPIWIFAVFDHVFNKLVQSSEIECITHTLFLSILMQAKRLPCQAKN